MREFLIRVTAFAALQIAIGCVVVWTADRPAESLTVGLSNQEIPRAIAHEYYRRRWIIKPESTQRTLMNVAEGALHGVLHEMQPGIDSYNRAFGDKEQLLRTAPGRRLILLGGSNLVFGMYSPMLAERYGLEPVNFGFHAALQMGYQLKQTEIHARSGDVVIYCFEYAVLMNPNPESNEALRIQICEACPNLSSMFADESDVTEPEWKKFGDKLALARFSSKAREVADRSRSRLRRELAKLRLSAENKMEMERQFEAEFERAWPRLKEDYLNHDGVYARSSFNQYGDCIAHFSRSPKLPIEAKWEPISDEQRRSLLKNIEALNRHSALMGSRGVDVYFAFAPMLKSADRFAIEFEQMIVDNLDAPILFPLVQAKTTIDEHYDSNYHLNWEGVCRRMAVWASALDQRISPVVSIAPEEQMATFDGPIGISGAVSRETH